jgi:hypothetical protein
MLVDEMHDVVLKQSTFEFDAKRDKQQNIYIGDYLDKGISHFIDFREACVQTYRNKQVIPVASNLSQLKPRTS